MDMLSEIVERYPREYTLKNGVTLRKVMVWVQGPDYDWMIDRINYLEQQLDLANGAVDAAYKEGQ